MPADEFRRSMESLIRKSQIDTRESTEGRTTKLRNVHSSGSLMIASSVNRNEDAKTSATERRTTERATERKLFEISPKRLKLMRKKAAAQPLLFYKAQREANDELDRKRK